MTKAFAIALLKQDIQNSKQKISYYHNEVGIKALELAIKALEQEPILDKIRAEIVDLGQRTMNDNRASGIWACRDIIDKYKVESAKESDSK